MFTLTPRHIKDVKDTMLSLYFDKMQALKNQKRLLILKRDRVEGLIKLINKTLKIVDNVLSKICYNLLKDK